MLPIRFDDIGPDDILRLISEKASERKILEYKQALEINPDEKRAEFLYDVSSFANASGGDLIFGIADEREDGRATGIPEAISPLQIGNSSAECARLEQIIQSGIEPRIPVVLVKPIEIPNQGPVIVIRVGKSWIAPHMVTFKNRSRFYSRNSTGKLQLDVQQIGAAFAEQRSIGERLRNWKADRIAQALAGEGPVEMEGPFVLLHFISVAALTDEQTLPRVFEETRRGAMYALISGHVERVRYNADGFLLEAGPYQPRGRSYLQIFRNGSLEYGDSFFAGLQYRGKIASRDFEQQIVTIFHCALKLLKELETEEPVYAGLTLIGFKGKELSAGGNSIPVHGQAHKDFDRDVIISPDVMIQNTQEGPPYPTTLLPIINSIWQAAGFPGTIHLNGDDKWDPVVFLSK
jgi:hypothetical protein